jgi:glucose-1-phosphate adenylyltransferase
MGIYLFSSRFLYECLAGPGDDFGGNIVPDAVNDRRVQAVFFSGYWRDIGTIRAFYDAHMDLVGDIPPFDFNDPQWPIYTHPRYLPGSRMMGVSMERSILADGAVIRDSRIEDSIIGVRAMLDRVTLTRTLVMGVDEDYPDAPAGAPPVGIGEGTVIENAIVDKNARIGRNVRLTNERGRDEAEGDGWVIRNGIIVLPKNTIIPDGTVV